jgi:hypothetical protein
VQVELDRFCLFLIRERRGGNKTSMRRTQIKFMTRMRAQGMRHCKQARKEVVSIKETNIRKETESSRIRSPSRENCVSERKYDLSCIFKYRPPRGKNHRKFIFYQIVCKSAIKSANFLFQNSNHIYVTRR